jgi:hypothetical protein
MKLGGVNVIPDRRDIPFLTDPANPTIVMGTPLTVFRTIALAVTHTVIRGGHVSPSPWVTTRT